MDSPLKTDARSSILFLLYTTAQGRVRRRGRCSRPTHGAGREGERPGLGRRGRVGGRVDVGRSVMVALSYTEGIMCG